MKLSSTKRTIMVSMAIAGLMSFGFVASCNKSGGNSQFEKPYDIPVGSKDAKVVLVEYASVMCPHCATFQREVLPTIMEKYVKTGKVRYVFREFPTAPVNLAMAGHLMARCVGPSKREAMVDTLMAQQKEIFQAAQATGGVKQAFVNIAASAGMSEADFEKCMENKEQLKILADIHKQGADIDKIDGTPSFFVNGNKVEGPVGREYNAEDISKALDAALEKAK